MLNSKQWLPPGELLAPMGMLYLTFLGCPWCPRVHPRSQEATRDCAWSLMGGEGDLKKVFPEPVLCTQPGGGWERLSSVRHVHRWRLMVSPPSGQVRPYALVLLIGISVQSWEVKWLSCSPVHSLGLCGLLVQLGWLDQRDIGLRW